MKTTLLITIASLFASFCPLHAQVTTTNDLTTTHVFDLPAAAVQQALSLYERASGLTVVQDSHVSSIHKLIHLHGAVPSSTAPEQMGDIAKIVEKDLLEQAGIVITPLDGKRASVTYNDALPIVEKKR